MIIFFYIDERLRGGGGNMEEPKIHEFHVDRPFLYRIVHKSELYGINVTLFSGRVSRPTYS